MGGGAGLLPRGRPGEMPAGGDVGPRDARTEPAGAWSQVDGGGRTAESAGVPSRAAASAAPLLPGMSEELPRRLPSILGSAASPTALAGAHSALTARRQQLPAQPGHAEQRRRDPSSQPPQQRLALSPSQRPPPASQAGGESHAYGDWLPGAGPGDVSVSLIRGFHGLHRGRRVWNCALFRRR